MARRSRRRCTGHPSVVMALQNQSYELGRPQGRPVHRRCMTTGTTCTLDGVFRKTYTRNSSRSSWYGSYLTNFGFVGSTDFYVTTRADGSSLRSRGKIHVDPDLSVHGPDAVGACRRGTRTPRTSRGSTGSRASRPRSPTPTGRAWCASATDGPSRATCRFKVSDLAGGRRRLAPGPSGPGTDRRGARG